ncbi:hypothetical protein QFZ22_002025 [Streptomyces canus]|uniref:Uncharacterized protein n=1 Tax=Streptomyces canus TaxID=58343 RepID=A0AAW8FAB5_9ACTN|nr:hypothetical protein [Streptomyces canus]
MTMYTVMTWDVSRTGGRGGLQLHWQERKGWFYALAGLSQFDVHFNTVLIPLGTPMVVQLTGRQGVAGSHPVVPTVRRVFAGEPAGALFV